MPRFAALTSAPAAPGPSACGASYTPAVTAAATRKASPPSVPASTLTIASRPHAASRSLGSTSNRPAPVSCWAPPGGISAPTDLRAGAGGFVAKGYNIGAYLIAGRATGIYAGLLAKFDKNDVRIRRGALRDTDGSPDFTSIGLEGEIGYRIAMHSLDLDFGAGLSRVNARIDGFDTGQIGFDFDVAKSLRSRFGARASFGGRLGPYLDGKLFHEFKDDAQLTFINGSQRSTVDTQGRGTWGRVEAGIGSRGRSGPIAAVWGEAGDVRGFGAKAGFRF